MPAILMLIQSWPSHSNRAKLTVMQGLRGQRRVFSLVFVVVALFGCDAPSSFSHSDYELKEDREGHLVRLNKRSGQISVLTDGQLVPIFDPERDSARKPAAPAAGLSCLVDYA